MGPKKKRKGKNEKADEQAGNAEKIA